MNDYYQKTPECVQAALKADRNSLQAKIGRHLIGDVQIFSAGEFCLYGVEGVLAKHMPRLIKNLSLLEVWFFSAKYHHIYNFFGFLEEKDRINDREKLEAAHGRAAEKKIEQDRLVMAQEEIRLEIQRDVIRHAAEKHKDILARKRSQMVYLDDYQMEIGQAKWFLEIEYFVSHVVGIEINDKNKSIAIDVVDEVARGNESKSTASQKMSSQAIGCQFEVECAALLMDSDWLVTRTKATGDQGVDLIANIESISVALQCKKYSMPVGNKAVQEIYAGASFAQCDFCVVVSSASFTASARQLAQKLGVFLVHQRDLPNLLKIIKTA